MTDLNPLVDLSTDDELLVIIAALSEALTNGKTPIDEAMKMVAVYGNFFAVVQLERAAIMLKEKGYYSATREMSERATWLKGLRYNPMLTTTTK